MKVKNFFVIFSLFMILIFCVSAVSAESENIINNTVNEIDSTQETISNSNDEQNIDLDSVESISNVKKQNEDILSISGENNKLSSQIENDIVSYSPYPNGDYYDISFRYSSYSLSGSLNSKTISYYVTPCKYTGYWAYDYVIRVYDGYSEDNSYYYWGNKVFESERIYGSDISSKKLVSYTFPAETFKAGNYYMTISNSFDNKLMAGPILLKVTDNAVISANDYNVFYNSGTEMKIKVIDQSSGSVLKGASVKVVFSNSKTSVIKYYSTNSNGEISLIPPLSVGTYIVTISPSGVNLNANAVTKTVTIKKSSVNIKAYKVTEYKGFKTTLKAIVKSQGKNVNEGGVLFKINGKSYKVAVKNGVATKKIKLNKVKTYKYTAKFVGNDNLANSKSVKSKAVLKNRVNVKITFKKPVVYAGQTKKVVVKIKAKGKYVKEGKLYVKHKNGVDVINIKNGKVTLYAYGSISDHYKGTNGVTTYYKKTVTKKFWIKFVPSSHKYKPVKVTYKGTSKYKCPTCGKTGSHNHYMYGYYVRYVYPIKVS